MDVVEAHRFSACNRKLIPVSDWCGCFYCLRIFRPVQVYEWDEAREENDDTALCPWCGVDAVIPSISGVPMDSALLKAMKEHWFS